MDLFGVYFLIFFQSDSSAILFKKSGNLPSEISHKIYIDKILNSFLETAMNFSENSFTMEVADRMRSDLGDDLQGIPGKNRREPGYADVANVKK